MVQVMSITHESHESHERVSVVTNPRFIGYMTIQRRESLLIGSEDLRIEGIY